MKRFVLIVAGGKGLRMGGELPKQFIPFNGKPVLMHTLEAFHRWDASASIVLVLPDAHQAYWTMLCKEIGCRVPHQVAMGGDTRFHSVRNGLALIAETELSTMPIDKEAYIAVHDGVRPFVSTAVIDACFLQSEQTGAAIPVVSPVDSLRRVEGEGSYPVDRSQYVSVQTPQVFRADILLKAYEQAYDTRFTDDASVVEAMGITVRTVEGNRENIKITTPFDLLIAKALFSIHE